MYKNNQLLVILKIQKFTLRYGLQMKRIIAKLVFENWVLRRIFGCKKDEVTGELRRLQNEELYVLYSSLNIVRVIK
jgi:hypothetical protein